MLWCSLSKHLLTGLFMVTGFRKPFSSVLRVVPLLKICPVTLCYLAVCYFCTNVKMFHRTDTFSFSSWWQVIFEQEGQSQLIQSAYIINQSDLRPCWQWAAQSTRQWTSPLLDFGPISAWFARSLLICALSDGAEGCMEQLRAGRRRRVSRQTTSVSIYRNSRSKKWEEKSESTSHFLPRSFSLIQLDLSIPIYDAQEAFPYCIMGRGAR